MNAILIAALISCPPSSIGRSIHLSVIRPTVELSITRPVTWAPVINRIAYVEVVPPATTQVYEAPAATTVAPPPPAADVAPSPQPGVRYYQQAPVRMYSAAPLMSRSVVRLDVGPPRSGYHARRAAVNARKAVKYTEKAAYHASRS